ncbi:MAG: hypothetical protein AMJ62_07340 [Myxococcales bacterium SG8_38]|nr:MAG: hypothetical protein AMJ62_07340 [Myxococcales bacterium SG8_38]
MPTPQETVDAVRTYLRTHPEELGRAVRSALGLRFGVPVAALKWLGQQAERTGKVEDFQIDAVPPGLRLAGNLDLMNTPVRASAIVYVERVVFNDEELTLALRLEEVSLKLNGESDTPVAALIKSGALDLSNPGTLVNFMPRRSPVLASANGNRIVLDLMRDPKIGKNPLVRRGVSLLTSFVTLHGVETDTRHLDIAFRALPVGFGGAVRSVRKNVVLPSMSRFLPRAR